MKLDNNMKTEVDALKLWNLIFVINNWTKVPRCNNSYFESISIKGKGQKC